MPTSTGSSNYNIIKMASWIWITVGILLLNCQLIDAVSLPKITITELKTQVLNVRTTTPTCAVYVRKQDGKFLFLSSIL